MKLLFIFHSCPPHLEIRLNQNNSRYFGVSSYSIVYLRFAHAKPCLKLYRVEIISFENEFIPKLEYKISFVLYLQLALGHFCNSVVWLCPSVELCLSVFLTLLLSQLLEKFFILFKLFLTRNAQTPIALFMTLLSCRWVLELNMYGNFVFGKV